MHFILSLFEVGAVGFWLLMVLSTVLFTVAAEKCAHFLAAVLIVILGLLYWNSLQITWQGILLCSLGYLLTGAIWSLYRWAKHVKAVADENKSIKSYKDWSYHEKSRIRPSENVSQISAWILYWPFSAVWNLTGDFLTNMVKALTNVYNEISRAILKRAGVNTEDLR